jgi:hypothetical protein
MSQLQTASNSQGSDILMTNGFGDQQGISPKHSFVIHD